MNDFKKSNRLLEIYQDLLNGKILSKKSLSEKYGCSEKSIQRDIVDLNVTMGNVICYDKKNGGYKTHIMQQSNMTQTELYAILKILFSVRAFSKTELTDILKKLTYICGNQLEPYIKEELFYYKTPTHTEKLLPIIENLSIALNTCKKMKIKYKKQNHQEVEYIICPVNLIFNEYYFYILAHIDNLNKPFPAIFRISRITDYELLSDTFTYEYDKRVNDGEYKKRIHYMYQGKLIHIKFRFFGDSLDAVLDRIPTAKVVSKIDSSFTIEADVYDNGIMMWLLSQQQFLEVLEPRSLRDKMKQTIQKMNEVYSEHE